MITVKPGLNKLSISLNECTICSSFLGIMTEKLFPCRQYVIENIINEVCYNSNYLNFTLPEIDTSGQFDFQIWCIGIYGEQILIFDETVIIKTAICQF